LLGDKGQLSVWALHINCQHSSFLVFYEISAIVELEQTEDENKLKTFLSEDSHNAVENTINVT